jgi:hypothetical protein
MAAGRNDETLAAARVKPSRNISISYADKAVSLGGLIEAAEATGEVNIDVAEGKANAGTRRVGGWVQPTNTGQSLTGRKKKVVQVGTGEERVGIGEVKTFKGKRVDEKRPSHATLALVNVGEDV